MAFREFFGRHRMASAVAGPAVLGVAAIVAASWALTATPHTDETQLKASVTECHDMVTISVAGRNDTPVSGTTKMLIGPNGEELPAALSGDHQSHWVDPVVNAPADDVADGSYAAVYIAYPANMSTYEDSVNAGVDNTKQVMREISQACPDTKFSIVGYSEGADVVRRVAMEIGHQEADGDNGYGIVDPDDVLGVVILADAGRSAGDGPFPGAKDPNGHPDGFDQQYQDGKNPVPGKGALPGTSGDFGALDGKIASFCSDGDLTCSAPENISLLQLAANVGRQINVDAIERDGLTPATGQDVAVTLGRIAMTAFADIAAQPNWMASDETFLDVLLKVSDPNYQPGQSTPPPAEGDPSEPKADAISTEQLSPLAYLPQKVFNEIVGLIATNQNTIPVILSDPYQLTLGPEGHHFDYWHDNDPENGKPMTSAEYAAAWLTYLAQQAQAGKTVDASAKPEPAELAAAYRSLEESTAETTTSATSSSVSSTTKPSTTQTTTRATTTQPSTTRTTTTTTTPETSAPSSTVTPKQSSSETDPTTSTPTVSTTSTQHPSTSSETTTPTPAPAH